MPRFRTAADLKQFILAQLAARIVNETRKAKLLTQDEVPLHAERVRTLKSLYESWENIDVENSR